MFLQQSLAKKESFVGVFSSRIIKTNESQTHRLEMSPASCESFFRDSRNLFFQKTIIYVVLGTEFKKS